MSTTELTLQEVADSVTGHDEVALETHFGVTIYDAIDGRLGQFRRLMIFVHRRHEGDDDGKAKTYALDVRQGDLSSYFAAPALEVDPDEPETAAGKEPSDPGSTPTTSQSSASRPE